MTSLSINQANAVRAETFSRLRAIEAVIAWSEGSASQEDSASALARDFIDDVASAISTEGLASAGMARMNVKMAKEGLCKEPFDARRIIGSLRKVARSFQPAPARWRLPRLPAFRRTVEVAVLTCIFLWLCFVLAPGLFYPSSLTRMSDFTRLKEALERYKIDHGSYPVSRNAGGGNDWTGIGWNGMGDNWLPELVPDYLDKLPRDPRNSNIQHAQYIYFSNGTDYKLLSMNAEECRLMVHFRPWLNDKVRNQGGTCTAYGFQTSGAKQW